MLAGGCDSVLVRPSPELSCQRRWSLPFSILTLGGWNGASDFPKSPSPGRSAIAPRLWNRTTHPSGDLQDTLVCIVPWTRRLPLTARVGRVSTSGPLELGSLARALGREGSPPVSPGCGTSPPCASDRCLQLERALAQLRKWVSAENVPTPQKLPRKPAAPIPRELGTLGHSVLGGWRPRFGPGVQATGCEAHWVGARGFLRPPRAPIEGSPRLWRQ